MSSEETKKRIEFSIRCAEGLNFDCSFLNDILKKIKEGKILTEKQNNAVENSCDAIATLFSYKFNKPKSSWAEDARRDARESIYQYDDSDYFNHLPNF